MSSILCNPNCPTTTTVPTSYWSQCDGDTFRKFAYPYYSLIDKCQIAPFTDLADLSQWAAAVTAGHIQLSPCGKIEYTNNQETSDDVDVCGGTTVITNTYEVTFSTYQTDPAYNDYYYFKSLLKDYKQFSLIFFNCDGHPYLPSDAVDSLRGVTGATIPNNVGFDFTVSSTPTPSSGDGGRAVWSWSAEIELNGGDMLCPYALDGLLQVLQG